MNTIIDESYKLSKALISEKISMPIDASVIIVKTQIPKKITMSAAILKIISMVGPKVYVNFNINKNLNQ